MPVLPVAPGTLTTGSETFSSSSSSFAIFRPVWSEPPPGPHGTIISIGRDGYTSCAIALQRAANRGQREQRPMFMTKSTIRSSVSLLSPAYLAGADAMIFFMMASCSCMNAARRPSTRKLSSSAYCSRRNAPILRALANLLQSLRQHAHASGIGPGLHDDRPELRQRHVEPDLLRAWCRIERMEALCAQHKQRPHLLVVQIALHVAQRIVKRIDVPAQQRRVALAGVRVRHRRQRYAARSQIVDRHLLRASESVDRDLQRAGLRLRFLFEFRPTREAALVVRRRVRSRT